MLRVTGLNLVNKFEQILIHFMMILIELHTVLHKSTALDTKN